MPHEFLRNGCESIGVALPAQDHYGCGLVFLPPDDAQRRWCVRRFEEVIRQEGQRFLGWRRTPVDSTALGLLARQREPVIRQVFIGRGPDITDTAHFERKLFVIRKVMERRVRESDLSQASFFMSPASPAAPWYTRACFWPTRSRPISPTWATRRWSAP